MASLKDLGFTLRTFLKAYRWRRFDPVPVARLAKPLSECRVALVTSAGLVVPGDEPFDPKVKGGDWSYRVIPGEVDVQSLEEHHRSDSFDHAGVEADRNMALPLDRLRELAADGTVGDVAPRHVSLMGSITATGRFQKHTVPSVVKLFAGDGVEVVLLVPV